MAEKSEQRRREGAELVLAAAPAQRTPRQRGAGGSAPVCLLLATPLPALWQTDYHLLTPRWSCRSKTRTAPKPKKPCRNTPLLTRRWATALVAAAQRREHCETVGGDAAMHYANRLGHAQATKLLRQGID